MWEKLVYSSLVVSLSFSLGACSKQMEETTNIEDKKATAAHDPKVLHWSYEGEIGSEHWGELDPSYSACVNGSEQSPINIEFSQVKASEKLENIQIHYKSTIFSLVNNSHTVQANPETANNSIVLDGKEYKLAQFHFHTPSEHQLNGQNYDMELHLVHQDGNGNLAVLGVMIQEGKENERLASVWDVLPEQVTEKDISVKEPVDLQDLLPSDQTSFHYNGSLTTPPCTEEVKWIIFEQPIEMSKEQIQAFQKIFPDNHRPVQLLNEREIFRAE